MNIKKVNKIKLLTLLSLFVISFFCIYSVLNHNLSYATDVESLEFKSSYGNVWNYPYTSDKIPYDFVVEKTGWYKIELWGASGGNATSGGNTDTPKGGYTSGVIFLNENDLLKIYVGEKPTSSVGGYNGGGNAYSSVAGGGGGATDIRYENTNLIDRIMVAAGGAGYASAFTQLGHGGGLTGLTGYPNSGYYSYLGRGGTQTAGGVVTNFSSPYAAGTNGTFGLGGKGGGASGGSAGGGGGYYGGSGGSRLSSGSWPGGGGSSFVSGLTGANAVNASGAHTGQPNHFSGKVFINAETIAGNATMPNPGGGTMVGNTSNGYARITEVTSATLLDLNVSLGELTPEFDSNIYEYDLELDSEQSKITINAIPMDEATTIIGLGAKEISTGNSTHTIIATGDDGTVLTYVINTVRPPSSYKYLDDIKINGESIPGFDPEVLEYEMVLAYDDPLTQIIDVIKGRTDQTITNIGEISVSNGADFIHEIEVTPEDESEGVVYKIHFTKPHTNLLKSINIALGNLTPSFNPQIENYQISISNSILVFDFEAIAYDNTAEIDIVGGDYLRVGVNTVTITVKVDGLSDKIYTIEVTRRSSSQGGESRYQYLGVMQTFIAPEDDFYEVLLWGASGGNGGGNANTTPKGGYTKGQIFLNKDEILYVFVGEKPTTVNGGYNGGGNSYVSGAGAGGGATDVRYGGTTLNDRIMVAGGGAGYASNYTLLGHAGGLVGLDGRPNSGYYGYLGRGGTQTAGGVVTNYNSSYLAATNGSFGQGGNGGGARPGGSSGGGGGYYGGSGGSRLGSGYWPGGGGSSFISGYPGANAINSSGTHSGQPNHFSGKVFTNMEMIVGNGVMPTPTNGTMTGNANNGYAIIRTLVSKSSDATLYSLEVDGYNFNEQFKPFTTEYTLPDLDENVTELYISALANDPDTTISGTGYVEVKAGTNTYNVVGTAADGTVLVYTITVYREASDIYKPINIKINGLTPSLCALDETYCVLEPTFDPDHEVYTMQVPHQIDEVTYEVIKGYKYQTVSGAGIKQLNEGVNVTIINVIAENVVDQISYNFVIERDLPINSELSSLTILNAISPLDPAFDPSITDYFVDVAVDTTSLILDYEYDANATVEVFGNSNFEVGLNEVIIRVTSAKGTTKEYIIHVNRQTSSNTYLSILKVADPFSTEYSLTPSLRKDIRSYTVSVPTNINEVNLTATPDSSFSSIEGTGLKSLVSGNNKFIITVTAEDETSDTYEINIIKAKSNNIRLSSLTILESEVIPEFNPNTLEYVVNVADDINALTLNVVPEDSKSVYAISGNKNFLPGTNNVTITVIAEDGTYGFYKIKVIKAKSTNNYLKNITISEGTLDPTFDKETMEYSITVPSTTGSVVASGIKEDKGAYVSGNGLYYLTPGENKALLTVTSASGDIRVYTITIIRETSGNANLIDIFNNKNAIMTPSFSNDITNYTINIDHTTDNISFAVIKEDINSAVEGARTYTNLQTGNNNVTITVTAPDGITQKVFNINVVRDKSTNANLKSLFVKEGYPNPEFNSMVIRYDVTIPYEYTSLNIEALPEYANATIEILGNENFIVGENEVIIRVTSEAGLPYTKDYTLHILRQEEETSSNHLSSLSVDKGTLSPAFSRDTYLYNVLVSNETTEIAIVATTEDSLAIVSGIGLKQLNVGLNYFPLVIKGTDEKIRTYYVLVERERTDDARLKSLKVNNGTLMEEFSEDVFSYNVTTINSPLDLSISPLEPDATYEIVGNANLVLGNNEVKIIVTAPNKTTELEYILNVSLLPSNNNNLESLTISDGTLSPVFNKAITLYTVNVDNDTNNVVINATAEDKDATIIGTGSHYLNVGINQISILVTSPSGNTKNYTLLITKAGSDNNYLSNLLVSEGNLNPIFDRLENNYEVEVSYEVASITLDGTLEDTNAVVVGLTNYDLKVGTNQLDVIVVSQTGISNVYTINVIRKEIVSARLLNIETSSASFLFQSDNYEYTFNVPNEVLSLENLIITPEDTLATYTISGNENFGVGMNTVLIEVTSSDNLTTKTYTLNINRQLSANNYLSYIYLSEGNLDPLFNKTTLNYTILVPNNIATIDILGEAESSTSIITGFGTKILAVGENKVDISVTSSTGITRVYELKIIRAKNNDNSLTSLIARDTYGNLQLIPMFDGGKEVFQTEGRYGQTYVEFIATTSDANATITGDGIKEVKPGLNIYEIIVTAEDGTVKTYTVHLSRPVSNNANLVRLVPSVGELSREFSPNITEYSIDLGDEASLISFEVFVENENSTVTGYEETILQTGINVITITVTAEDKTTKNYVITVNKTRMNEARLVSLEINEGTLTPEFNSDNYVYNVLVPNAKLELTEDDIIATTIDESAIISKDNPLSLSDTEIRQYKIEVTAKDGFTTQTYTLNVRRKSTNNNILDIIPSFGALNELVSNELNEYSMTVPSSLNEISFNVTTEGSNTNISGNNNVQLIPGENIITVLITSENGEVRTVTINVYKTIDVSEITVDKDNINMIIGDIEEVTATVLPNDASDKELLWTSSDNQIAIVQNGEITAVSAGTTTITVSSASDPEISKTIQVSVRAKETSTNITDIIPSIGELDQEVSNNLNEYTITVDSSVESISFEVITESTYATVTGNKNISLTPGENPKTIIIIPEDGNIRTINIVITRSIDVTDITLDKDTLILAPFTNEEITATVIPENATDKTLNWTSSNSEIATVQDGIITAVAEGTTTITVSSVSNPNVSKSITVTVLGLTIESSEYEVTRYTNEEDVVEDYIIGAEPMTTITDFISKIDNPAELLKVYDKDDNEITNLDTFIGTGMKIKLETNGTVYDSLYIIIRGDANGDGQVNAGDAASLTAHMLAVNELKGIYQTAIDLTADTEINASDAAKLTSYLLGNIVVMN